MPKGLLRGNGGARGGWIVAPSDCKVREPPRFGDGCPSFGDEMPNGPLVPKDVQESL